MTYILRPGILTPEEVIAEHFGSTIEGMKSKSRLIEDVEARQVAMWFYVKKRSLHMGTIGRKFNRDHSTVNYSFKRVNDLMYTDKLFRKKVQAAMILLEKIPAPKKEE